MNNRKETKLFSDTEFEMIIKACMLHNAPGPTSEQTMIEVMQWAEKTRAGGVLLQLVINGEISVSIKNGEAIFQKIERDGPTADGGSRT